jgi:hypothetical protein
LFHLQLTNNGQFEDFQSLTNGLWVQTLVNGQVQATASTPTQAFTTGPGGIWNGRGCRGLTSTFNGGALGVDSFNNVVAQGSSGPAPWLCILHM